MQIPIKKSNYKHFVAILVFGFAISSCIKGSDKSSGARDVDREETEESPGEIRIDGGPFDVVPYPLTTFHDQVYSEAEVETYCGSRSETKSLKDRGLFVLNVEDRNYYVCIGSLGETSYVKLEFENFEGKPPQKIFGGLITYKDPEHVREGDFEKIPNYAVFALGTFENGDSYKLASSCIGSVAKARFTGYGINDSDSVELVDEKDMCNSGDVSLASLETFEELRINFGEFIYAVDMVNIRFPDPIRETRVSLYEYQNGGFFTCFTEAEGGPLKCGGTNTFGQLGTGAELTSDLIEVVIGFEGGATKFSVSNWSGCAIKNTEAFCWGRSFEGSLGRQNSDLEIALDSGYDIKYTNTPLSVIGNDLENIQGFTDISLGLNFTCAIIDTKVNCWGNNTSGSLGNPVALVLSSIPVEVPGIPAGATSIEGSCAISQGAVYCWGLNDFNQLGDPLTAKGINSFDAIKVVGLESGIDELYQSPSGQTRCALKAGDLYCWGRGSGLIGNLESTASPEKIAALPTGIDSVALGDTHACVVVDAAAHCWGSNQHGQLGREYYGSHVSEESEDFVYSEAEIVVNAQSRIKSLSVTKYGTCATMDNSELRCWGAYKGAYGLANSLKGKKGYAKPAVSLGELIHRDWELEPPVE